MNYKFCPKCAGKLEEKANHEGVIHPTCSKCGFVFYQNSKPTASPVILNDKDEVLLVKRAIEPHFGKWDLPGGFLENGEELIVGLKREAREELGVEIEPLGIISIFVDKYGYAKGDFFTFNVFVKSRLKSSKIKLDSENSDFGWFAKENVPWGDLAFANTTIALKTLYNLPGGREILG
ncbi:MAG: GDP-mannose mannosyl hydrolase [candidate division WS2 bacterium ADurb.Bin280]|uniref:GDP-mannose mannosyl hydrolase n=1 Tax=candidate division WS2 bacterium ADurb.Bin280 TaxID=1852829 RepID=A0A1V5SCB3_9BACT|nr:MAG: GDP-mannose mannosyl hydrolase [candidate division WS2 bacterium ADurb.Bin280]